jgi:hypothetical protein
MMAADSIVKIEPIPVMYVAGRKGASFAEQAPAAFVKLEAKLPCLKGKKFYGAISGNEYRACVAIDHNSDASPLPCPTWTIPGGRYVRRKIRNWEENLHLIGQIFEELSERPDFDSSRPCIEYYRSQKELLLMAPVK